MASYYIINSMMYNANEFHKNPATLLSKNTLNNLDLYFIKLENNHLFLKLPNLDIPEMLLKFLNSKSFLYCEIQYNINGWVTEVYASESETILRINELRQFKNLMIKEKNIIKAIPFERQKTNLRQENSILIKEIKGDLMITEYERFSAPVILYGLENLKPNIKINEKFFEHIEEEYSQKTSEAYYHVYNSGKPHFDEVLCNITNRYKRKIWLSYQRYIFRCKKNTIRCVSRILPANKISIPFLKT